MTENSEAPTNAPATIEEIAEVIQEFEQYRERLLNETMTTAKKAKLSKKQTLAQLEPELAKIDSILQQLKDQHATLSASN